MMAVVSTHSSNPFRPLTSEVERVPICYNEMGFLPDDGSSNDPICGYTLDQTAASRRLMRRSTRLNQPEKGDDELLLSHSTQKGEPQTTDEHQAESDRDEEEIEQNYIASDYVDKWAQEQVMDDEEDVPLYDSEDEELSLTCKPPEEQEEIREEINELHSLIPGLSKKYRIFDRLGTGMPTKE
jgi:cell division control protein 7